VVLFRHRCPGFLEVGIEALLFDSDHAECCISGFSRVVNSSSINWLTSPECKTGLETAGLVNRLTVNHTIIDQTHGTTTLQSLTVGKCCPQTADSGLLTTTHLTLCKPALLFSFLPSTLLSMDNWAPALHCSRLHDRPTGLLIRQTIPLNQGLANLMCHQLISN